ncbi:hypothetical protein D3OALGA1CA_5166 [Olavius algarvensis associated proteobacterium Delta 3]|nr:hypothetical protein D3OALGB2SA_3010 [Olavius algarvensis associated proteobacterium Delta 3]CAB5162822.1 hypothetical protein D3OALGA1CA_5166 [Olavius algarvensis associated proteobacterium Delta 3]
MGISSDRRSGRQPSGKRSEDPSALSNTDRGHSNQDQGFFDGLSVEFLIHELKDPISIIETGARTLLERQDKYGALTPKQEKTLKRMLRNTRKTRSMLYDLLEVGRSESGVCLTCRFRPVQALQTALMEALDTLPAGVPETLRDTDQASEIVGFFGDMGIRLEVTSDVHQLEIFEDEIKFRQIVGNLIKNALHHRKQKLDIRMAYNDGFLCIDVTDDGPGVDPKNHSLIFERYAQVNECAILERKGHGLGLAGALRVARCLGGDIHITSKKGAGATFHLRFPCSGKGIGDKIE